MTWFKSQEKERRKLELVAKKSEMPRPADPGIVSREKRVEIESLPLSQDPQLARLERAVKLSEGQLNDLRTTMAQDLVWALVNSPSFLFNR